MGNRSARPNAKKDTLIKEKKIADLPIYYYGNVMAVIKLRKHKKLSKLSDDVFRCVLEY